MKLGRLLMIGLLIISFAVDCAKEPTQELQNAEKGYNDALAGQAQQWAPERFKSADEKLKEGKALIASKSNKEAKAALLEASLLFQTAISESKAAKQLAQEEAERQRLKKLEEERAAQIAAEQQRVEQIRKQETQKDKPKTEMKTAQKYVVVKGDCLWNIAKRLYGDPWKWKQIYEANKHKINNPDLIYPGQVFEIPGLPATP